MFAPRAPIAPTHRRALLSLFARAAFYLPGVAPKDFTAGERVELKVNKLTSTRTHLPYDYYSLPYCHPHIHEENENLGGWWVCGGWV